MILLIKILNQKYPEKTEDQENLNDTDSEKRKLMEDEEESGEEVEVSVASKESCGGRVVGAGPGRNRQLSTDTINDPQQNQ